MRRLNCILIIIILFCTSNVFSFQNIRKQTIILSSKDDPYFKLADEISKTENIDIYHSLDEIINLHPAFLLWVISPGHLSEKGIVNFSLQLKKMEPKISVGIISGQTIEQARNLWLREKKLEANQIVVVNKKAVASDIQPGVRIDSVDNVKNLPLTNENIIQNMKRADYFTLHLHGSTSAWWDEKSGIRIKNDDIPALKPCLIISGSCRNFRIWEKNSIALSCVQKGAAAFTGFVFSPKSGCRIGEFNGYNYLYTWADFPIGHVVQIQNHASLQSYANFPFYYLMGDPRLYFQEKPPYTIQEDKIENNERLIKLTNAKIGVLPVYIPNGSQYKFVSIHGIGAANYDDAFFNNSLQMVDIDKDKYLLVNNKQANIDIHLKNRPSWFWIIKDFTVNVLDLNMIVGRQYPNLNFIIIGIVLLFIIIRIIKRKYTAQQIIFSIITGAVFSLLCGLYTYFRWDYITVTSKSISFNPLSLVSYFLLVSSGTLIFMNSKSFFSKALSLCIAFFQSFSGILMNLVFNILFIVMTKLKSVEIVQKAGKTDFSSLYTFIFEVIIFLILIYFANRIRFKNSSVGDLVRKKSV